MVIKALEDEWYVVIKAYKLTVFEILRDFFVLSYIACPRYPYIRVYRLYDIMLAAQVDHFDITVNGMYFASYDYPVTGRSNMTIYAHQVQTLGSISYSEVPLSSGMVTDIPQTQVPCQLDCMQSTSSVILQPSTLMTDTGTAVSTGHLGKL